MKKLIQKVLRDLKKFLIDTNSISLIVLLIVLLLLMYILFLVCQYLGGFFPYISLNISLVEPFILFFTIVASFTGVVYSSYQLNKNQKRQIEFDKIYNQLLYLIEKNEYYLGDMNLIKALLSKDFFQLDKIEIINNIIVAINYNHLWVKDIILQEKRLENKVRNIVQSFKNHDIKREIEEKYEKVEFKIKEEVSSRYSEGFYGTKEELENEIDQIIEKNFEEVKKELYKELEKESYEMRHNINDEIKAFKEHKYNCERCIEESFKKITEQLHKLIENVGNLQNFNNEIIDIREDTTIDQLNMLSNKNQIVLRYIIFYLLDNIKL